MKASKETRDDDQYSGPKAGSAVALEDCAIAGSSSNIESVSEDQFEGDSATEVIRAASDNFAQLTIGESSDGRPANGEPRISDQKSK